MRACYFCGTGEALTTRTRPDGTVADCPTCVDCAERIDEQNIADYEAYIAEQERRGDEMADAASYTEAFS